MPHPETSSDGPGLPRGARWLLRALLPPAERDEVLDDLAAEHRQRARRTGRTAAWAWAWRQVLGSAPALARRAWWRGWIGFQPRANRWQPGGTMFESWANDLRYALRRLRLRPTYAALTVLTLALGVAGTAAVYSIASRLLVEPLPVRAEEEVAVFWHVGAWSEAEFLALRPEVQGFRSLAAFRERDVTLRVGDAPARLEKGVAATAELFQVLGVGPVMGPGFRAGDDRVGTEPVAVLSHAFWRDLGGDPAIVGKRIELGGVARTVAGVMPPGFWFPDPTVRVWVAEELNPEDGSGNWGMGIEDRPDVEDAVTAFRVVTPDYFRAMGIRVRSGRGLRETDRAPGAEEGAVVVNQALADLYFPGQDPVGRRIAFMEGRWDRIMGVVENVAEGGLSADPVPARYMVYEQVPWLLHGQTVVVRVRDGRDPASVLDPARRAMQAVAPGVAVREMTTLDAVFTRAIGPARQVMALLTLLGALALALGTVGVYGVVSHFATRRRRDWGIRIALGMRPARVVRQVVGQGGRLVGAGIALGLAAFLVLARLLAGFLYGVGAADPVSMAGAAAVLLAAGLLAAYLPARRTSRIDPALALREP